VVADLLVKFAASTQEGLLGTWVISESCLFIIEGVWRWNTFQVGGDLDKDGTHSVGADLGPVPLYVCRFFHFDSVGPHYVKLVHLICPRTTVLPISQNIVSNTVDLHKILQLALGHWIVGLCTFFNAAYQALLNACAQLRWLAPIGLLLRLLPAKPVGECLSSWDILSCGYS
jgi:hypothetical protein